MTGSMKHPLSTLLWFNLWFCKQNQTHIQCQCILLGKKQSQSYLCYVTTLSDSSGGLTASVKSRQSLSSPSSTTQHKPDILLKTVAPAVNRYRSIPSISETTWYPQMYEIFFSSVFVTNMLMLLADSLSEIKFWFRCAY